MFEVRGPPIFPHAASAWWIPILLTFGWGPLYLMDVFLKPENSGPVLVWFIVVALPCTIAAALSVPAQAFRLLMYFLNRPKPLSK
jgi:hypothetical protein